MKIDCSTASGDRCPGNDLRRFSGIFPYLGATVDADSLMTAVISYGAAVIPGRAGARLATRVSGTSLIDPAAYDPRYGRQDGPIQESLWPCDEWLDRQRAASVPLLLTDSARLRKNDRSGLRRLLGRWEKINEPTLVVLPIEAWWLGVGLQCLIEEVRAAGRPIALVLLHHYNALDLSGSVSGLLELISAVAPLPVVLLRCDASAIGAVAHGAFAGFIGMSASLRHGPLPIRVNREAASDDDKERDQSPAVLVPMLNDYYKASKLPAFGTARQDLVLCECPSCAGGSLLEITRLCETDIAKARARAYIHNVAFHERIASEVLGAPQPKDAWWERCKASADVTASLIEFGVSLPVSRWLRQWIELGSPSHDSVTIG